MTFATLPIQTFLPFVLLWAAVILSFIADRRFSLGALALAVVCGVATGVLQFTAVASIICLGLSIWLATNPSFPKVIRYLCYCAFLALAVALMIHLVPGFNNLLVFERVQFSPDSIPFTMYLNFDKIVVGVFICILYLKSQRQILDRRSLLLSARCAGVLISILMGLAFLLHYVRFDFKFPEMGWIWILNNLFFVCFAEEAFFRGFVQGGLTELLPKTKMGAVLSIAIAALLFGLAHFPGGVIYVVLSTVAGLFYGYAFWKTDRIQSSILVHFSVNLVHFLFFSYPALGR